jgi:thiol-disulfide isomerase/thioredoxin
MNAKLVFHLLLAGFLATQSPLWAQIIPRRTLPDDPVAAWAEVQKGHAMLRAPEEWRKQEPTLEQVALFQKEVRLAAAGFVERAREFVERFPEDEHVGEARVVVVHAWNHAVAAGDADAEQRLLAYVAAVLSDQSIPEDIRAGVLAMAGTSEFLKKTGMRWFTEGPGKLGAEFDAASVESTRAALKEFPNNSFLFTMLTGFAERAPKEQRKELATEILNAPGAPAGAKTLANHMLKGTKPYEVGKPVEIRFTALDGREVDLAKLKGKVVLVEFWSTTCGPCMGEMPAVKATYEKLRGRGFEIVAISLDQKESDLRRVIQEKELPWPQYFDGKGWENQFAVRYGVFGLPTMWLVDKRGNLRDTDARFDLERRVNLLLEEKAPTSK